MVVNNMVNYEDGDATSGIPMDLPVTTGLFYRIREHKETYMVDKSMLIDHILSHRDRTAFLFTRPRRFGKTTNLTMVRAFLDMRYRGNDWFEGMEIDGVHRHDDERNAYPVIHLNLKDVGSNSYGRAMTGLMVALDSALDEHRYLWSSDSVGRHLLDRFDSLRSMTMDHGTVPFILGWLVDALYEHHGRKVVVLVDEFDSMMQKGLYNGYYGDAADTISSLLAPVVKDNPRVRLTMMVGITRMSGDSMFSGFNNVVVDDVFSSDTGRFFGFTHEEVRRMCEIDGHPDMYGEMCDYYDGYTFGGVRVLNPRSVAMCIDNGYRKGDYWTETGVSTVIGDLASRDDPEVRRELLELSQGLDVERHLPHVMFPASGSVDDMGVEHMYSLMVQAGFLTAEPSGTGGRYRMRIPNTEMYREFSRYVCASTGNDLGFVSRFCGAVMDRDDETVAALAHTMFAEVGDPRVLHDEKVSNGMMTGVLMGLYGRYRLKMEMQAGQGFVDIGLIPRSPSDPTVLIEVKRHTGPDDAMRATSMAAMDQILDRRYHDAASGRVIMYGVAVCPDGAFCVSDEVAPGEHI